MTLTVERDGDERDIEVGTRAAPDGPCEGKAQLGIVGRTRDEKFDYPVDVKIDTGRVGGPSAGLAFTLTIIDELTPGDLTGGRPVAVTGTIEPDGRVGPIGGVAQKAVAAKDAGARLFIVPGDELRDAREHADGMKVVGVATLDEALARAASRRRRSRRPARRTGTGLLKKRGHSTRSGTRRRDCCPVTRDRSYRCRDDPRLLIVADDRSHAGGDRAPTVLTGQEGRGRRSFGARVPARGRGLRGAAGGAGAGAGRSARAPGPGGAQPRRPSRRAVGPAARGAGRRGSGPHAAYRAGVVRRDAAQGRGTGAADRARRAGRGAPGARRAARGREPERPCDRRGGARARSRDGRGGPVAARARARRSQPPARGAPGAVAGAAHRA